MARKQARAVLRLIGAVVAVWVGGNSREVLAFDQDTPSATARPVGPFVIGPAPVSDGGAPQPAGVQINRSRLWRSPIALTPGHRSMLIGEEATLSLHDGFGLVVPGALWTSSDIGVVLLSEDDPPGLRAVSAGNATIAVEKDGRTAEATIAVFAGADLPSGTIRWSVPPTPGRTMESPIYVNRVAESDPELFIVETETWGQAMLRGVDADGRVLWQQHSPGIPLMGDSFGGVIAGELYDVNQGDDFRAYVRLGDAGGVSPWRYESPGSLLRPAQAPDGTLYAIEFMHGGVDSDGNDIWDKHAIVIDGSTGTLISRWPLAREVLAFESENDGLVLSGSLTCRSTRSEMSPETVGPIVGSDGRGYLLVRRRVRLASGDCSEFNGSNYVPARRQDVGIDLIALSASGDPMFHSLYALACTSEEYQATLCDLPPDLYQLLPDGVGGLLASWRRPLHQVAPRVFFAQNYFTSIDAEGTRVDTPVTPDFGIDLIGQAGTAYVHSGGGTSAIDVRSWTAKWTSNSALTVIAARPDGGAAVVNQAGDLQIVGPTGQVEEDIPFGLSPESAAHESDDWVGVKDGELTSVSGPFQDATRWTVDMGNPARQFAIRRAGMGIFLKSQEALIANTFAQHNAIRVVPFDQEWLASRPELQAPPGLDATDGFGNRYFTLGAGLPGGTDTGLNCGGGNLTKGIDRKGDVAKPVKALRKLPVAHVSEGATIFSLLIHFNAYADDVPYWCTPGDPDVTTGLAYNSNSFIHGLLHAAGVPHEEREPKWPAPGWSLPLPQRYFLPR